MKTLIGSGDKWVNNKSVTYSYGNDSIRYIFTTYKVDRDFDHRPDALSFNITVTWDSLFYNSSQELVGYRLQIRNWNNATARWDVVFKTGLITIDLLTSKDQGVGESYEFFNGTVHGGLFEVKALFSYHPNPYTDLEFGPPRVNLYSLTATPTDHFTVEKYTLSTFDSDSNGINDSLELDLFFNWNMSVPFYVFIEVDYYRIGSDGSLTKEYYDYGRVYIDQLNRYSFLHILTFKYIPATTSKYLIEVNFYSSLDQYTVPLLYHSAPLTGPGITSNDDLFTYNYQILYTPKEIPANDVAISSEPVVKMLDTDFDGKNDSLSFSTTLTLYSKYGIIFHTAKLYVWWWNSTDQNWQMVLDKSQYYDVSSSFYVHTISFETYLPYVGAYKVNMSVSNINAFEVSFSVDDTHDSSQYTWDPSVNINCTDSDKDDLAESCEVTIDLYYNFPATRILNVYLTDFLSSTVDPHLVLGGMVVNATGGSTGFVSETFSYYPTYTGGGILGAFITIEGTDMTYSVKANSFPAAGVELTYEDQFDFQTTSVLDIDTNKDNSPDSFNISTAILSRPDAFNVTFTADIYLFVPPSGILSDHFDNPTRDNYTNVNILKASIPVNNTHPITNVSTFYTELSLTGPFYIVVLYHPSNTKYIMHGDIILWENVKPVSTPKDLFIHQNVGWADKNLDQDPDNHIDSFELTIDLTWLLEKQVVYKADIDVKWFNTSTNSYVLVGGFTTGDISLTVADNSQTQGFGPLSWSSPYSGNFEVDIKAYIDGVLNSTYSKTISWKNVYEYKKLSWNHSFGSQDTDGDNVSDRVTVTSSIQWTLLRAHKISAEVLIYYLNETTNGLQQVASFGEGIMANGVNNKTFGYAWDSFTSGKYRVDLTLKFDDTVLEKSSYWWNTTSGVDTSTSSTSGNSVSSSTLPSDTSTSAQTSSTQPSSKSTSAPSPLPVLPVLIAIPIALATAGRRVHRKSDKIE